ncbi:MAG: hypothetical protein J5803_00985, partial [Desulfovibrio sp.]|nr:hypothetical protein [Desulfovibrio sp.]
MNTEDRVEDGAAKASSEPLKEDNSACAQRPKKKWGFFGKKKQNDIQQVSPEKKGDAQNSTEQDLSEHNEEKTPIAADAQKHEDTVPAEKNVLERIHVQGFFLLLLFLFIQWAPDLYAALTKTALYCPAETDHILGFLHAQSNASWLAPIGYFPAQWPGLIWLTTSFAFLCPSQDLLFACVSVFSVALLLFAVWNLARLAYGYAAATCAGLLL